MCKTGISITNGDFRFQNVTFYLTNGILALQFTKNKIKAWFIPLLLIIIYSLSKAEMLFNGTGNTHFLTYVLFYLHFYIIDKLYKRIDTEKYIVSLCIIPWVTILLVSGPYCAVYFVAVLLIYCLMFIGKYEISRKQKLLLVVNILIPFTLYMISNSFAVEETPGMLDIPLTEVITSSPEYMIRFLLKGFSSAAIDGEWLRQLVLDGQIGEGMLFFAGTVVVLGYAASIYIYFKEKLYRKTIFPLALLLLGFGSHLIVFLGRYGFLTDEYSMSSRYFLQYQQGLLGIILTFAVSYRERTDIHYKKMKDSFIYRQSRAVLAIVAAAVVAGNVASCVYEIKGGAYRRDLFHFMKVVEQNYHIESDELLEGLFEYGGDAGKIRNAFRILEENNLNVFYKQSE